MLWRDRYACVLPMVSIAALNHRILVSWIWPPRSWWRWTEKTHSRSSSETWSSTGEIPAEDTAFDFVSTRSSIRSHLARNSDVARYTTINWAFEFVDKTGNSSNTLCCHCCRVYLKVQKNWVRLKWLLHNSSAAYLAKLPSSIKPNTEVTQVDIRLEYVEYSTCRITSALWTLSNRYTSRNSPRHLLVFSKEPYRWGQPNH